MLSFLLDWLLQVEGLAQSLLERGPRNSNTAMALGE
jgi:hypothetical protein